MIQTRAPKQLWDYCLELQVYIRSLSTNDIFEGGGEVPETLVSGETADISPFAEFAWYDWLKFRDDAVAFPEDREVLGRYLGPAIGVGPATVSYTHLTLPTIA